MRSEAAASFGLTDLFPEWVAPADVGNLPRTFLQSAWLPALGLIIFTRLMTRLNTSILGYGLFRLTSDIEKLPFPLAPMNAEGMMVLADDFADSGKGSASSWRWRCFAIGGAIGMGFGFLYMGIPALSGAFLGETIQIFPIPFVDWTPMT